MPEHLRGASRKPRKVLLIHARFVEVQLKNVTTAASTISDRRVSGMGKQSLFGQTLRLLRESTRVFR